MFGLLWKFDMTQRPVSIADSLVFPTNKSQPEQTEALSSAPNGPPSSSPNIEAENASSFSANQPPVSPSTAKRKSQQRPPPYYSPLGEFLYGLENLRKKRFDKTEVQEEDPEDAVDE